jgi:hypothetical protein
MDFTMIMASSTDEDIAGIRFVDYVDESQLEHVMSLVGRDLSEPYSSTFAKPCDPWLLYPVSQNLVLPDSIVPCSLYLSLLLIPISEPLYLGHKRSQ